MFFSVITKSLNCEILTKNLATLKDNMRLRMKNFNILRVHWKIWFLAGGSHEKWILKGALDSLHI